MHEFFNPEYAEEYLGNTMASGYTANKNMTITTKLVELGCNQVLDVGGNVSVILRTPASLRTQLEKQGIEYLGLDLSLGYYDTERAKSFGYETYPILSGIVGDARAIPIQSNSMEAVVCADVLEHITNPEKAIGEIHRVLKPGGRAVIVVPSLYKLDVLKIPQIIETSYSTHVNRMSNKEWIGMIQDAGFSIDPKQSRPIGIASGLLYSSWVDPGYIPLKRATIDNSCKITSEEKAKLFSEAIKSILTADPEIDNFIINNPSLSFDFLLHEFQEGNVTSILKCVITFFETVVKETNPALNKLIKTFEATSVPAMQALDDFKSAIAGFEESEINKVFFGNSAMLVLQK